VKPERFVLENVSGMKALGCLAKALEHMAQDVPDYTITHFELSPEMFAVCLLRPRIYFIGIRTNKLLGKTKDGLLHEGLSFIKHIRCPVGADFITFLSAAPRSTCV
jgi:site-specific DNA-cytosine methylase